MGPSKKIKSNSFEMNDNEYPNIRSKMNPLTLSVYTDPESGKEKITLAMLMSSGTKSAKVFISANGLKVIISQEWPKILTDVDQLFAPWLSKTGKERYHPKVLAMKKELEKYRGNIDEIPVNSIEVDLPFTVQNNKEKVIKDYCRGANGEIILFVELEAYETTYFITEEDTKISF